MKARLSIVVPVYRSAQMLPELVAEIAKSTDALGLCDQFELVLVNDGSPDDSWQVIAKLAEANDLKGVIEALLRQLHLPDVSFAPAEHPTFHPGKCAVVKSGEMTLGVFGELHPLVKARFDFVQQVVVAADLDATAILAAAPVTFDMESVPAYPPILEDIAIIVDETVPAGEIEALIRQTGGKLLQDVRLFDIFRGAQIGDGKKSMAYSLTYQAADRTLTDQDAAQLRNKIVRRLEQQLGARLRAG